MEKTISAEGIVLKSFEYNERQRICTIFTKDHGIVSCITRPLSRKDPNALLVSTPLCRSEFTYTPRTQGLSKLVEATVLDSHQELRASLELITSSSQLITYISESQLEGKPAPRLYELLRIYLKKLPLLSPRPLIASFLIKLLTHEGLFNPDEPAIECTTDEWNTIRAIFFATQFSALNTIEMLPSTLQKLESCL